MTDYKNLIDGEMVDNGEWLEVLNPANEQVVGRVPAAGKDELDRAVAAARRAFKSWKKTSHEERQQVIQGIAAAIKENADELFRLLTTEQGKPHAQAQQEIYGAAGLAAAQSTLTLDDVDIRMTIRACRAHAAFPWAWSVASCRGTSRS